MKTTPVDNWYAVEWSPAGGLKLTPFRQVLMRNQRYFMDAKVNEEVDYHPLWIFPTMEEAEEFKRNAVQERRTARSGRREEEGGKREENRGWTRMDADEGRGG